MSDNGRRRGRAEVIFLVLCVLSGLPLCLGGVDPASQRLFTAAARQTYIFVADAAPFQLEADFKAQMQVPTEGHLSLKWDSKDRLWRRIVDGGFEQIDIKNGELVYLSRSAPFTPIRVGEVISLLAILGDPDKLEIKKARNRTELGVSVTCFEVRPNEGQGRRIHEICVNPSSHEVLSEDWDDPPDEHRRVEFSDYSDFHGHRYPRKIALIVNGSKVIQVSVVSLDTAPLADATLVPPPGAIVRRLCAGIKHPVPVKTPDPLYPKSSSENRLMGDTTVAMTVLPDGSVDNIQVIGTSTRAMDDATLQTLKSWKFKPAMCGSDPVTSDITVVVSLRLQ
jgi:TonB family protein